jgi:hypothetical protein
MMIDLRIEKPDREYNPPRVFSIRMSAVPERVLKESLVSA